MVEFIINAFQVSDSNMNSISLGASTDKVSLINIFVKYFTCSNSLSVLSRDWLTLVILSFNTFIL